jgi:ABC-type amino acid transport substrate-binding protein
MHLSRYVAGAVAAGVPAAASACAGGSSPTNPAPTSAGPTISTDAALHAALPPAIRDAGVIRFAGDSHPPYRAVGTDGTTVTGIDPDLQAALGTDNVDPRAYDTGHVASTIGAWLESDVQGRRPSSR